MNRKKSVLIFLPSCQDNHESYYNVLINRVFSQKQIIVLAYNSRIGINKSVNTKIVLSKKGESLIRFTLRNSKYFFKASLIVFEELYSYSFLLPLYLFVFGKKTLLSIHNVNKWLRRENDSKISLKNFTIQTIIKSVKGLIVISLSLKEYIQENKLFTKEIYYFPFIDTTNAKAINLNKNKKLIQFTIPGTINTERRDYKVFLKAILLLIQKNHEVQLTLLGKVVRLGEEERKLILEINRKRNNTVKYWNTFIDNNTFETEILKSNFLIGNINIEYTENQVREVYGQSKETGVLFLMLKYGIPTLFPKEYRSPHLYNTLILKYENSLSGILECLQKIVENQIQFEYSEQSLIYHEQLVNEEIVSVHKSIN